MNHPELGFILAPVLDLDDDAVFMRECQTLAEEWFSGARFADLRAIDQQDIRMEVAGGR